MKKHLRTASAESFDESGSSVDDFSRNNSRPSGIEFSRREITSWLLFFAFGFFLLLVVLRAGKYFMINP